MKAAALLRFFLCVCFPKRLFEVVKEISDDEIRCLYGLLEHAGDNETQYC